MTLILIVFNNILYWLDHHRCDKCKNMYAINFIGESGHKVGIKTKIKTTIITYSSGKTRVSKMLMKQPILVILNIMNVCFVEK